MKLPGFIQRNPSPSRRLRVGRDRAFSLVELISVVGITALVSTLAVSAFKNTTVNNVSAGLQKSIVMFSMARSDAAVKRIPCRVAIAADWTGNEAANYRAISLWRLDPENPTVWSQVTNWEYLPEGVFFHPDGPGTLPVDYGSKDLAYLFDPAGTNVFTAPGPTGLITMRFLEFLPNGSVRIPGNSTGTDFLVRVTEGYLDGAQVQVRQSEGKDTPNYADIVTDSLVGRIKAHRE